jgi:hypothetical protein
MHALPAFLALELAPLSALAQWPTVSARIEALAHAWQGNDTATSHDVATLRAWSRRWTTLHPSLASWYASHAHADERIAAALYHILEGRKAPANVVFAATYAYRDTVGREPAYLLVPHIP